MSEVDISVVIATYRREQLLPNAIGSILSQQGLSLEVIVVDDSPEGGAARVVEAMRDSRIRYLHRTTPSGGHPGAVRNDGVAIARGPLLHFLDDDDELFEGSLLATARALASNPVAMAFGRVVPFGDNAALRQSEAAYFQRTALAASRIRGKRRFAAQLLFKEMPIVNSACTIRRQAFVDFGGYDTEIRCCEDVDLFLRVGRARGFVSVDRDVLRYRVGAPSIMNEFRLTGGRSGADMVQQAYRKMHDRYKMEYGEVEYRALQAFTRARNMLALSA